MLLLNLSLLIDVTFSTPTGDSAQNPGASWQTDPIWIDNS